MADMSGEVEMLCGERNRWRPFSVMRPGAVNRAGLQIRRPEILLDQA